jgi:hypothetical protein
MTPDTILIAFYVITAMNVIVAASFAATGLARPEAVTAGPVTESSKNFALYAAARALPLAFVTIVGIVLHHTEAVFWLGVVAGFAQLADAGIGWRQRELRKTLGPLIIAVLQFGVLILMQMNALG